MNSSLCVLSLLFCLQWFQWKALIPFPCCCAYISNVGSFHIHYRFSQSWSTGKAPWEIRAWHQSGMNPWLVSLKGSGSLQTLHRYSLSEADSLLGEENLIQTETHSLWFYPELLIFLTFENVFILLRFPPAFLNVRCSCDLKKYELFLKGVWARDVAQWSASLVCMSPGFHA